MGQSASQQPQESVEALVARGCASTTPNSQLNGSFHVSATSKKVHLKRWWNHFKPSWASRRFHVICVRSFSASLLENPIRQIWHTLSNTLKIPQLLNFKLLERVRWMCFAIQNRFSLACLSHWTTVYASLSLRPLVMEFKLILARVTERGTRRTE